MTKRELLNEIERVEAERAAKVQELAGLNFIWDIEDYARVSGEIEELGQQLGVLRLRMWAELVGERNIVVSLA